MEKLSFEPPNLKKSRFWKKTKIKLIFQKFSHKISGQICMGKIKKQPPRKWTLFKNEERFFQTATGVSKMKVQYF
jgi:hypothetical protein